MEKNLRGMSIIGLACATMTIIGFGNQGQLIGYAAETGQANQENKVTLTEEALNENDRILYTVNAGTPNPTIVPSSEKIGLLQSNVDQEIGKDVLTGMLWGLDLSDKYSRAAKFGDDATDVGTSYIYMADDVEFDKDKSKLGYSFQIPQEKISGMEEQLFEVTVAFKHHWDNRLINIMLEGQSVAADVELNYGQWESRTFTTKVVDGELNVAVKSPRRSNNKQDPLLNYIKVQTVPEKEKKESYTSFTGAAGELMYDTNGNKIQAHGGQIQKLTVEGVEKYYWIGEDKTYDYRPVGGIHMYSSTDLYNWEDEGVVLQPMETRSQFETDDYFKTLYGDYSEKKKDEVFIDLDRNNTVIERPKILYNDKTGKYVIWFHADGRFPGSDADYGKAKAGVAISDSPTGPFKLLGSYKLNYHDDPNADFGFDGWGGRGSVRDMTLFKDTDGTAYVIYSSEGNRTTYISKLNDDYTQLVKDRDEANEGVDFTRAFVGWAREAPAMFQYKDKYYMINSGMTGWSPNPAQYAVADHPLGPWTGMGDPSVDWGGQTTYDTQSTNVIPVDPENGKYIYMGDRWNSWDLSESRYIWLPIEFKPNNQLVIRRVDNWTLDELNGNGLFEIESDLPQTVSTFSDIKKILPAEVTISFGTEKETTPVTWSIGDYGEDKLGTVTITGTLPEKGRDFTHEIHIVNPKMQYFLDSGAETSTFYDAAKLLLGEKLLNKLPDQKYSPAAESGYLGITEKENSTNFDIGHHNGGNYFENGWWAANGKTIDYAFELEPGTYTASAGFQEWWDSTRNLTLSISTPTEGLNAKDFKLTSETKDLQVNQEFSLTKASTVTISISKNTSVEGGEPVLSWLAILQNEKQVTVDYSSLDNVLAEAKRLNETEFKPDAWQLFSEAIAAAELVRSNSELNQAEVDQAVTNLEASLIEIKKHFLEELVEVESLTFNVNALEILKTGKTLTVLAEIMPKEATATKLTWAVQKEDVATIDNNGVVTAKKPGTTYITAISENGKQARFTLRVTR